jgi:hypothetical protein
MRTAAQPSNRDEQVISDRDVWQAAVLLVKRYGDDAMLEASQRANQLLDQSDMAGAETWRGILNAIERLQAKAPWYQSCRRYNSVAEEAVELWPKLTRFQIVIADTRKLAVRQLLAKYPELAKAVAQKIAPFVRQLTVKRRKPRRPPIKCRLSASELRASL